MKIKYIMLFVVLVIVIIFLLVFRRHDYIPKEELGVDNLKSFSLSYTSGYMMNSDTRYRLTYRDGEYIANIKPRLKDDEEGIEIAVNKEMMEEVSKILIKYDVGKWNGFDKVDKDVLDGNSFSFIVVLNDDKVIKASGYMKWPKNYREVVEEIEPLFMNIYNKNSDEN